jgi:hypothetical protein
MPRVGPYFACLKKIWYFPAYYARMSHQGKRRRICKLGAFASRWRANGNPNRETQINTETEDLTAPLLSNKTDVDVKRTTALHLAVARSNDKMLKCLLDSGAPADPQDDRGDTPSHFAAQTGQLKLLLLLFHSGADWSVENNQGYDVLTAAEKSKWTDAQKRKEYLLVVRALMSNQRRDKQLAESLHDRGRIVLDDSTKA